MKDMKGDKDNRTNSENSLDSFDVMEEAIDLSIQQEYDSFSEAIDINNVGYKEVLKESKNLFLGNIPIETKKRILILLAHFGNAESYRIIEKYLKEAEENLRDWALLSLKECRMFLESALLEKEGGIISTGLGGKDNKFRYYFVVSSKDGLTFSETHKNTLKREFETISQKYNSEIEEINFEPNYAMLRTLIPMDFAAGEVIEEGIRECNKVDDFLYFHYYITNVRKPTNEEIFKYLEEIRQGGK
jgi:hypothetical protein